MRQVVVFMLVVFTAGIAQAALVAQYAGPTTFDGTFASDIVLPDVNIGDEGAVEFEFKTNSTTNNGHMWTYSDDLTSGTHEYRIFLVGDMIKAFLYSGSGYKVQIEQPFSDTSSIHSVRFSWKNGSDSLFTLDGVTTSYPTGPLVDFAAANGHTLGHLPTVALRYTGMLQNVNVYDSASIVPEPTSYIMFGIGIICIGRLRRRYSS